MFNLTVSVISLVCHGNKVAYVSTKGSVDHNALGTTHATYAASINSNPTPESISVKFTAYAGASPLLVTAMVYVTVRAPLVFIAGHDTSSSISGSTTLNATETGLVHAGISLCFKTILFAVDDPSTSESTLFNTA